MHRLYQGGRTGLRLLLPSCVSLVIAVAWQFIPIAGQTFTDSGTGTCH